MTFTKFLILEMLTLFIIRITEDTHSRSLQDMWLRRNVDEAEVRLAGLMENF